MKSKLQKLALLAALASTSAFAQDPQPSSEFSIVNNTSSIISFKVNKVCSNEIGDVSEYSVKSLQLNDIMKACAGTVPCNITAYEQAECSGEKIGNAKYTFDPYSENATNAFSNISLSVAYLHIFLDELDQQA